jgi:putative Mn2+ efflux pump MntP
MLSLIQIILLAAIAATPALVSSLANHHKLGEPEGGNALRASAILAMGGGILALAGHLIGEYIGRLMEEEMIWLVDTLWFVVGLKMIFTSFRMHPRDRDIDFSELRHTLLAGIANGIDSLLIGTALGMIGEDIHLFVIWVAGLILLFALSGFKLFSSIDFLTSRSQRLLMISGVAMMLLALFVF